MLFGPPSGGFVVGFEGSFGHDVAYSEPGAGTYLTALITFGVQLFFSDLGLR